MIYLAPSHSRDAHVLTVLKELILNCCQRRHNQNCGAYVGKGSFGVPHFQIQNGTSEHLKLRLKLQIVTSVQF